MLAWWGFDPGAIDGKPGANTAARREAQEVERNRKLAERDRELAKL